MNCAWCSPSDNGTDGICDVCMLRYFNVNPATIHAEIASERNAMNKQMRKKNAPRSVPLLRTDSHVFAGALVV